MGSDGRFEDRKFIVALSGGIACYKTATLVSHLVQAGGDVTVLMTEAATHFIGPMTLQSLSGKPVIQSLWDAPDHHDAQHVQLARSADAMILAPASANTIAKLAGGICDNVVTTVACALPRDTPMLIAPAMNADMWAHPITRRNVKTLTEVLGWHTVGPETGWQACRTQGAGRMSEPEAIVEAVERLTG